MLHIERLKDKNTGATMRGVFVRRGDGKTVALGACDGRPDDWLIIAHKRYSRDPSLVAAIEKLTSLRYSDERFHSLQTLQGGPLAHLDSMLEDSKSRSL